MKKYTKILSLVMAILMIAALFCGCESEKKKIEALAGTWLPTASDSETEAPDLPTDNDSREEETVRSDLPALATLFRGYESEEEKIEALAGTWYMKTSDPESEAQSLLEYFDFYPEEIACVDLTTLKSVRIVRFTTEKTYFYAYAAAGTETCTRAFFEGAFDAMYENRASLGSLYDVDFESVSKEEFLQFYADLYGAADYSELVDSFVDNSYDYDALSEPWEEGTYSIEGDIIAMTILGESAAETLEYSIEGNTLTLTYSDGVEVYTRGK